AAARDLGGVGDLEMTEAAVDHRLAQAVEREADEAGGDHQRRGTGADDGERQRRAPSIAREVAQAEPRQVPGPHGAAPGARRSSRSTRPSRSRSTRGARSTRTGSCVEITIAAAS